MMQRGENSAQRTTAGVAIGNCGEFGVTLPAARATARATALTRSPPRKGRRALSRPIRELRPPASTYPEHVTGK
jgi:hypothetical protein